MPQKNSCFLQGKNNMATLLDPLYPAPEFNFSGIPFYTVPGTDAESDNVHVLFKTGIVFNGTSKVLFHLAVHGHYCFYINGFHATGPVRSTDSRIFYDSYDLTDVLQKGENFLTLELHYPGSSYRTVPAGIPAFTAAFEGAEHTAWHYAPDLRHKKSFEFTFQLGKCENRDDREENFTFTEAEKAVNPNKVELLPRPIPPLTCDKYPFEKLCKCGFLPEFSPDDDDFARRLAEEVQFTAPEAFKEGIVAPPPPGYHGTFLIFDLEREFYGKVEIELETQNTIIVDRSYAEMLTFSRVKSRYAFGKWRPKARHAGDSYRFADRRILPPGKHTVSVNFSDRGGRFLEIALRNHTREVKINRVTAVDRIYPVHGSFFKCDDPFFNRLDAMCDHTVRHCAADTFVDCPWREQAFWINDLEVAARYYFLLSADPALIEHILLVALDGRKKYHWMPAVYPAGDSMPFLSIPAIWVIVLYDLYLHCGKSPFIEKMVPVAMDLLNDYKEFTDETGLVPEHPAWWNFIDLAYVNSKADLKGHTAVLNALIAAAWRCVARMGDVEEAERNAASVCDAMKKHLWNDSLKMFRDSDVPRHGFDLYSSHPAAILLCYDLMPELSEALTAQLYGEGVLQPEPYYQRFTIEAALKTGQLEKCDKEIRRIWGKMVDSDSPTVWELAQFGPLPDSNTANSCCHAFSAAPMWYCRRVLAGIRPVAPGYKEFTCQPVYKGDFHCIQPTPYGNIEAIQKDGNLTVKFPPELKRV